MTSLTYKLILVQTFKRDEGRLEYGLIAVSKTDPNEVKLNLEDNSAITSCESVNVTVEGGDIIVVWLHQRLSTSLMYQLQFNNNNNRGYKYDFIAEWDKTEQLAYYVSKDHYAYIREEEEFDSISLYQRQRWAQEGEGGNTPIIKTFKGNGFPHKNLKRVKKISEITKSLNKNCTKFPKFTYTIA